MKHTDFNTPGQYIKELVVSRGWTQRVLAIILGVNETGLNHVITGMRPITAEMAIQVGEIFDIPPEEFLELQQKYDLAQARILTRPDPGRAKRTHLFGGLPVTEMIKRGWLDAKDVRDVEKVESELVKFFGVNSVDEIEILPHAAKKTETFSEVTPAQMAWIYRVKQIANETLVKRYSPASVRSAVTQLNNLLSAPEEARKVPRILTECGVRFVVVETLSSAKIDGVCFWLNDFSPVIGMTLRYDRIDNFWFVLRHELEHVLKGHGRRAIMLDAELEGERAGTGFSIADEERIANEAAANFCVPQKRMESFVARKAPLFHERDILGLANTLKIHPGLIVGQLQRITGKYNYWREHLVRIRSIITPNVMSDGWGDVAPID
jgi:HTH-type transcriptional regulator/antitoxin HigA